MLKPMLRNVSHTKKNMLEKLKRTMPWYRAHDEVNLNIWGVNISVSRHSTWDRPSELSVIVPRAEIKHSCHFDDPHTCTTEIVLSSITVVIAPRHPTEKK